MNNYTIPLAEALSLARKRQAERYAATQADLDDLVAAGCTVNISTAQLIVLEDAGHNYNFETGLVEDFTQSPDNPRRGLSVEEVRERLANLIIPPTALNRQQFYTQVAQTLPASESGEVLRELTAEMTAAL